MKRHIEQTATASVDAATRYLVHTGAVHKLADPVPVLGTNVVMWMPPVQRKRAGVNRRCPLWKRVVLRLSGKLSRPVIIG